MKKGGDILIELIGLSSDNEKVITTLKEWSLYPTQKKDGTIAFTATQYGEKSGYSILLTVSAKKIGELRVWDDNTSISLEMPFGIKRTFNQQELINHLTKKGFVVKELEKATIDFYTDNGQAISAFIKGKSIYYKDMTKAQLQTIIDEAQLRINKEITAFVKDENRYIMLSFEYDIEKHPTIIGTYVVNEIKKNNFKKYFKKEFELLTATKISEPKIKFETGKLGAIKNHINTLEWKYLSPYIQYIDYNQGDIEIVNDCEEYIKTGSLKATLVDVSYEENSIGYQIYIHYKNEQTKIKFDVPKYRNSTMINALNKILKNEYQMRLEVASEGNDSLGFLTLSIKEWKQLEVDLGKSKLAEFFKFTTELLF